MPELQKRPSFGIALSGGGYRATTLALGWVRALHQLGAMDKARYLSSNSGGSWFTAAYSYTQFPTQPFLGATLAPKQLDIQTCRTSNEPGSYGRAIADGTIVLKSVAGALLDFLADPSDDGRVSPWSAAVSDAFLVPFGVGGQKTSVTALGTRGDVGQRLADKYPEIPFLTACATPDKPFPILMGSVLVPEAPTKYAPIEFTPLYAGVLNTTAGTDPLVGGGYVEPLLLNTYSPLPPKPYVDGAKTVSAESVYVLPLVSMVGISSSFAAQGVRPQSDAAADITGAERARIWNLVNFADSARHFADGGGVDNLAITPLLQRGVRHIVCGVATVLAPDTNATHWATMQWDVAGLFGAVPVNVNKLGRVGGMPVKLYNDFMQVFPASGYDQLYKAMASAYKAGKSTTYRAKYQVLDNAYKAVRGGWEVDVLWLFNNKVAEWERALPAETQNLINQNRAGTAPDALKLPELKNFPYVSTLVADYSPVLVTLLSQLASYQALNAQKDIQEMMAAPPTPRPGAKPAANPAAAKPARGGR